MDNLHLESTHVNNTPSCPSAYDFKPFYNIPPKYMKQFKRSYPYKKCGQTVLILYTPKLGVVRGTNTDIQVHE